MWSSGFCFGKKDSFVFCGQYRVVLEVMKMVDVFEILRFIFILLSLEGNKNLDGSSVNR